MVDARRAHRHRQRQHLEAGARVVGGAVDGDRQEVGDLPEEQHREQRQPRRVEVAGHRRPAHERRQRARHRADEQRRARVALQRRVDRDVAGDRDAGRGARSGGCCPGTPARRRRRPAPVPNASAASGDTIARGSGPIARPLHQRVGVALQVHVEGVRRGDQQRRADQGHDRRASARCRPGASQRPPRKVIDHQPGDARLAEADHARGTTRARMRPGTAVGSARSTIERPASRAARSRPPGAPRRSRGRGSW